MIVHQIYLYLQSFIYDRLIMQENLDKNIEKLFKETYPMLFCYAQKIVGYDDAEDVLEEVFLDICKRKDFIEIGDKINSFLFRAVYTRCINILHRRNSVHGHIKLIEEVHQRQLDMLEDDHNKIIIEKLENNELGYILKKKIEELPEKCRESFKMSYIYNMRNEDIADVLNVSIRTVESHIYHALKILRNELKQLKK